jgi:hypothetical protein
MPLNDLKKLAKSFEDLINWIAESLIRGFLWRKPAILLALFAFFLNPPLVSSYASFLGLTLPGWYKWAFWISFVTLCVIAVIVRIRELRQTPCLESGSNPSLVKGLLPYEEKDADAFSKLQRQADLRECVQSITSSSFHFGILYGTSGCGKTSFLQAGLIPELKRHKYLCVYVKVAEADPIETVRHAALKQIEPLDPSVSSLDFPELLSFLSSRNQEPVMLILDQFEQSFRGKKAHRKDLMKILASWYLSSQSAQTRILVSLRTDFFGSMIEHLKTMRYDLGPHDVFQLQEFTPEQAILVLVSIAESENIPYDESFLGELVSDLACETDGLVSPVDIQVLSWMILRQRTSNDRRFTRASYQRLGGVQGLLESYLGQVLAVQNEANRSICMEILLSMADLETGTSRGMLSIAEIRESLPTRPEMQVVQCIAWLARSDVRLLRLTSSDTETRYEIAHDKLIPVLNRLAGKAGDIVDRANRLIRNRAPAWLASNKPKRLLLSYNELRLARSSRLSVSAPNKELIETFIAESKKYRKRRIILYAAISTMVAVTVACYFIWRGSPPGQVHLARSELTVLCRTVRDSRALQTVATDLAEAHEYKISSQLIPNWRDPSSKIELLCALAKFSGTKNRKEAGAKYVDMMIETVPQISEPFSRARALAFISRGASAVGDKQRALEYANKRREVLNTLSSSDPSTDAAFSDTDSAPSNFDTQFRVSVQVLRLTSRAMVAAKSGLHRDANALLLQAIQASQQVTHFSPMPDFFGGPGIQSDIVEDMSEIAVTTRNAEYLRKAAEVADSIEDEYIRSKAIRKMAESYAHLGHWREARSVADLNFTHSGKAVSLSAILRVWGETRSK